MNKEKIIKKHLEGWSGLNKASIEHYAETGKISGSLFIAMKEMLDEYAYQEIVTELTILKDMESLKHIKMDGIKYSVLYNNIIERIKTYDK